MQKNEHFFYQEGKDHYYYDLDSIESITPNGIGKYLVTHLDERKYVVAIPEEIGRELIQALKEYIEYELEESQDVVDIIDSSHIIIVAFRVAVIITAIYLIAKLSTTLWSYL